MENISKNDKLAIITLLSNDIRNNWGYFLEERQTLIIKLCKEVGRKDLAKWLIKCFNDSDFDGRDLRDGFELYDSDVNVDEISKETKEKYGFYFTSDYIKEKLDVKEDYHEEEEINHCNKILKGILTPDQIKKGFDEMKKK